MRFHALACEVLEKESMSAAKKSPHVVDIYFLPFGSHDRPEKMRATLQTAIDEVSGRCDYILLAYGLCGTATAGLFARETPLVIPRAHECITILLGSKELYMREFRNNPGTYYFAPGFIDRKKVPGFRTDMHILPEGLAEERRRQFAAQYGVENAAHLAEQEKEWAGKYNRAAFVNTGVGDVEYYRTFTKHIAETRGWDYVEIPGDLNLLDKLFAGEWDPEKFLVVQPGQKTIMDYNSHIISAV